MSCVVRPIGSREVRRHEALVAEYVEECCIPSLGKAAPQWEMYAALEARGFYQVYGAYVGGELVGFAGVVLSVNPHYGWMMASVMPLFVTKRLRGGFAFARLRKAIEAQACRVGCREITYSAMAGSELEVVLAKRYARTNSVFCVPLAVGADAVGEFSGDAGAGGGV